ncbi:MAG: hypothetical protein JWM25_2008 [Thermoleophilia bacterium]|nr:hypothetical protein [Thermoleophilia bacterium]MCZ4497423.1 hypothetical protein [Thermoleophilia bacterium]
MARTQMTTDRSPAVLYSQVFGVVLTLVGILGLFVTTSQDNVESLLGFDVNLTHNFVHIASGLLGLAAGFTALLSARVFALGFGLVYTALAVWGFAAGDGFDPFGILGNVNMADNVLHLAIGLLGLGAWAASRSNTRNAI